MHKKAEGKNSDRRKERPQSQKVILFLDFSVPSNSRSHLRTTKKDIKKQRKEEGQKRKRQTETQKQQTKNGKNTN